MIKKSFLLVGLFLLATSCGRTPSIDPQPQTQSSSYNHQLTVGDKSLFVEIVSDENKMQTGLSYREKMDDNNGMLFDFENKKASPKFWMKDMLFDIDLIWIADKKIIGITPNVPRPQSPSAHDSGGQAAPIGNWKLEIGNLPTYSPPAEVDQVLEVNVGWSEKNKIKVGDEVRTVNYSN